MAAEVLKRVFASDLQGVLFANNTFYAGCKSDDAAIDAENIEIPQDENGQGTVIVNPTKFPLEMRTEEDTKKTYAADFLVTIPEVITYNNQLLTSYDKRALKLQKHKDSLSDNLADRILQGWANTVSGFKFATTGAASRANEAFAGGNSKRILAEADLLKVLRLWRFANLPNGGRVVCTPDMYEDMLAIKKAYGSGTDSNNKLLADGAVDKVFGFDVFLRSKTVKYNGGTGAKKAIGAAGANTDSYSAIFYHPSFVRYIKGQVMVNMDPAGRPDLAGGVSMNAMVRAGGTSGYNSELGVITVYQGE